MDGADRGRLARETRTEKGERGLGLFFKPSEADHGFLPTCSDGWAPPMPNIQIVGHGVLDSIRLYLRLLIAPMFLPGMQYA